MDSLVAYNNKIQETGRDRSEEKGFTLIELSIVLVIIGLIVGGILVGQDLIKAAEIRATVGQVEKYNSAVNTFRTKYNAIPGDITTTQASAFGLYSITTNAGSAGFQDGNGQIEGGASGAMAATGETLIFWRHLSDANLVDGQFGSGTDSAISTSTGDVTSAVSTPSHSLPPTKTTPQNYFLVYALSGINYYQIMPVSGITTGGVYTGGTVGLSPIQSYNMDIKLDDGLPRTGIVQAVGFTSAAASAPNQAPSTATTSTSNTCVVEANGASTTTADTYNRVPTSGGNDGSCSLRFRFN